MPVNAGAVRFRDLIQIIDRFISGCRHGQLSSFRRLRLLLLHGRLLARGLAFDVLLHRIGIARLKPLNILHDGARARFGQFTVNRDLYRVPLTVTVTID